MNLVQEYYFSTKLKEIAAMQSQGIHVINLGIGSPDMPPSHETITMLSDSSENPKYHSYQSYIGIPALRDAFAYWYHTYYGVTLNPANEILPLMGSKEGIMHIAMTYLEPGDEVLVPNPGYPAYRAASLLTGATVVDYALSAANAWLPDFDELEEQDLTKVKLMWVNYPHMPTGAQASQAFFEELIRFGKKHNILIVNDNPYSFILNNYPLSILSVDGAKDIALELNSLSKSHNMAGWRVGMLAGNANFIADVLRFKSNMDSGMFLPIQLAAAKALHNTSEWYRHLNEVYEERQQKVFELLRLFGCEFSDTQQGMFVWAKVPTRYADGYALSDDALYNAHVFITPGGIFGSQGNGYIRISLCSDVSVFEEAIRRVQSIN